jgi:hypothetical protein
VRKIENVKAEERAGMKGFGRQGRCGSTRVHWSRKPWRVDSKNVKM